VLSALLMCSYTLCITSRPFWGETWFVDCSSFNVHVEGFVMCTVGKQHKK